MYYCDPCSRRYGSRRLLDAADRFAGPGPGTAWPPDGWQLWLGRRSGRPIHVTDDGHLPYVRSTGGRPHGPRERVGPVQQPGGYRFIMIPLDKWARAAQLICYRCPNRPRPSRTALVRLAEQTIAAGRQDAYV
jgi:hypothetical protein